VSRIVQVVGFYAPTSGGLRTAVDALAVEYQREGHETVLVIPGSTSTESHDGPNRRIELRSPPVPGSPYRLLCDVRAVRAVLDRVEPDRIEVHDKLTAPAVGRWAARRGVPAVLVTHERLDGILASRVPSWFPLAAATRSWNRKIAAAFPACVAASAYSAAELEAAGATVERVPLGVDLELFRPGPLARPPVVALVGRLSREKRPELALETFRHVSGAGVPARFVVVGDGPERVRLERAAHGLPVTFTGHLDRRAVARVLATASVLVAPCPVETFGLAVLEALASGTPVVAVDEGAAPELVAEGTGFVAPGTPEALADAVLRLLGTDHELAGARARAHAESFTWAATAAGLLAVHGLGAAARAC
jgi:alpha-1,6-mannosyltransferase